MSKAEKFAGRRANTSLITTIIGISLVLFFLGIFNLVVINTNKISNYYKEQIKIDVYLKDSLKQTEIAALQKTIGAKDFVHKTEIIDKQEAKKIYEETFGEDFSLFLGENILPASISVYLKAGFVNTKKVEEIVNKLSGYSQVSDVRYQKDLIQDLNDNAKEISFGILLFDIILMVIALAMINNTIRLAIYSKRFLIRSMQLVGATSAFIQRPFIFRGLIQGFISSVIAFAGVLGVGIVVVKRHEFLKPILSIDTIIILGITILSVGLFMSWFSTFLAVRKYLRLQSDKLF